MVKAHVHIFSLLPLIFDLTDNFDDGENFEVGENAEKMFRHFDVQSNVQSNWLIRAKLAISEKVVRERKLFPIVCGRITAPQIPSR
jgi:hypothetical protein